MRVIIFLPSIEKGGVERNCIFLSNYLIATGEEVEIVYTRIDEQMRNRFHPCCKMNQIGKRLDLKLIHPRFLDSWAIFFGFIRFLNKQPSGEMPVVVSFQSNILAILAARITTVPVVVRVSNHPSHTWYESSKVRKLTELLKRFIYQYANVVVTNSVVTTKYYQKLLSVPVETIYNPINLIELGKQANEEVDHPWLKEKKAPVIISVGRLSRQKNFGLLIEAFSQLNLIVDSRLMIIGEGTERAKLKELIMVLGLDQKVDLIGYEMNVHRYVARADLFVLSSNYEGLPNALIEAIAVGTPVISTNCLSGPSEILMDGKGGDLVPTGDSFQLFSAIIRNLLNKDYSEKKLNCAIKSLDRFEEQTVMKDYSRLLERLRT